MNRKITEEEFNSFRSGDTAIFEFIFKANYGRVKHFIRTTIKSDADAEELTQDVFFHLWENRDKIRCANSFYAYLNALARNKMCDFLRNKIAKRNYIENQQPAASPHNEIVSKLHVEELELHIGLLVEKMPPQRKRIFIMSRNDYMSVNDIAEKLQLSPKTVYTHIDAALNQLKSSLGGLATISI